MKLTTLLFLVAALSMIGCNKKSETDSTTTTDESTTTPANKDTGRDAGAMTGKDGGAGNNTMDAGALH